MILTKNTIIFLNKKVLYLIHLGNDILQSQSITKNDYDLIQNYLLKLSQALTTLIELLETINNKSIDEDELDPLLDIIDRAEHRFLNIH